MTDKAFLRIVVSLCYSIPFWNKHIQDAISAVYQSDVVFKIALQLEMEPVIYLYFHQRLLSYFLEAAFTVL